MSTPHPADSDVPLLRLLRHRLRSGRQFLKLALLSLFLPTMALTAVADPDPSDMSPP